MKPVLISPSLLSCDFANLEKEMDLLAQAGADWLHVDVMDGHFVKNITMGPPVLKSIKKYAKLPLDVHLMIEKPERYVDDFLEAGADILTVHVEATKELPEIFKKIKKAGKKVGLTLRPKTPASEILPYLDELDLILVMTVEPGFGGQSFMEDQLPKIELLSQEIQKGSRDIYLEVDGGINAATAKLCREKGAHVFVAGNYIFGGPYKERIETLRSV